MDRPGEKYRKMEALAREIGTILGAT